MCCQDFGDLETLGRDECALEGEVGRAWWFLAFRTRRRIRAVVRYARMLVATNFTEKMRILFIYRNSYVEKMIFERFKKYKLDEPDES